MTMNMTSARKHYHTDFLGFVKEVKCYLYEGTRVSYGILMDTYHFAHLGGEFTAFLKALDWQQDNDTLVRKIRTEYHAQMDRESQRRRAKALGDVPTLALEPEQSVPADKLAALRELEDALAKVVPGVKFNIVTL